MRSRSFSKTVALAAAGMLLAPPLAAASDVEADLRQMEQRMANMEDRLQAATDQLAEAQTTVQAQQQALEASGPAEERGALSSLSSFLESTDFNAWVAASYNYKFRGTSGSDRSPVGKAPHLPYHANGNTFQLDQVWFEIDKAPTEESRGGAHVDLAYGVATNNVPGTPIYTAYVSYLAPVASGLQLDLGVLPTLVGAEVIQVNANFNVTRGLVWGIQPINHTGALASLEVIEGLSVTAGVLNEPTTITAGDPNRSKAFTGQVAYGTDKFRAGATVVWGREAALPVSAALPLQQTCLFVAGTGLPCATGAGAASFGALADNSPVTVTLIDALLTADPLENLSMWVNYDYRVDDLHALFSSGFGGAVQGARIDGKVKIHGLAAAVRLGVLDTTGIALRGEWVHTDWGDTMAFIPNNGAGPIYSPAGTLKQYSLTGTLDHALTDNLTTKVELRWDHTNPAALAGRGIDPTTGGYTVPRDNEDALVVMLQAMYQF